MIFTSNDSNLDLTLDLSVFPESFEGLSPEILQEYVYTLEKYEYDADYMENNLVYPPLRAIRARLEVALGYKLETEGWLAPSREEYEAEEAAAPIKEPVSEDPSSETEVAVVKDAPVIFYSNDQHLDLVLDFSVFPNSFEELEEDALQEYIDIFEDYAYKADYMENNSIYPALSSIKAKLVKRLLELGKSFVEISYS